MFVTSALVSDFDEEFRATEDFKSNVFAFVFFSEGVKTSLEPFFSFSAISSDFIFKSTLALFCLFKQFSLVVFAFSEITRMFVI
jgi:hypothetical protein